ncbi:MAG: TIGR04086 family membrane protein [Bacilli bacterium]|nr:TIGR04086 family membrane protein [Bacilli bacterium]
MKDIKKYGKQIAIFTITIILSSLLFSTSQYFHLLNGSINHILSMCIIFGLSFYFGTINGKNASKNGYLEGLKLGGLILLLLFLSNTIMYGLHFKLSSFIYYSIILALSVVGAMIGINKKKK